MKKKWGEITVRRSNRQCCQYRRLNVAVSLYSSLKKWGSVFGRFCVQANKAVSDFFIAHTGHRHTVAAVEKSKNTPYLFSSRFSSTRQHSGLGVYTIDASRVNSTAVDGGQTRRTVHVLNRKYYRRRHSTAT